MLLQRFYIPYLFSNHHIIYVIECYQLIQYYIITTSMKCFVLDFYLFCPCRDELFRIMYLFTLVVYRVVDSFNQYHRQCSLFGLNHSSIDPISYIFMFNSIESLMMDNMGGLVSEPPQFNGFFYFYWRFYSYSYLRSTNNEVCSSIQDGQMCPIHVSKTSIIEPKPIMFGIKRNFIYII